MAGKFSHEDALRGAAVAAARRPNLKVSERDRLVAWLEAHRTIDDVTACWLWTGPLAGQMGYGSIHLVEPYRRIYVHRLAAHLFLGLDLDSRLYVLHRCDTPACFNPDHLFTGTAGDNIRDCVAKGRFRGGQTRGGQIATAKLTPDDVRAIRAAAAAGESFTSLAGRYPVSATQIAGIVRRVSWKHVE